MIKRILNFVRESKEELQKVTWPNRDEVTSLTMVVIVAVVIVSLFLWLIDTIIGTLINTVMN